MALSKTSGGTITLTEAVDLVSAFRTNFPSESKGSFIGADNIMLILAQDDCIGIRTYNGYDEKEGAMVLVMVGVDSDEKDMTSGYIMDRMIRCPNVCDVSSPLV